MAEIANAWISIVPDTSKIAPGVKRALGQADGSAVKAGASIGQKLSGAIGKTMKAGAIGAGAAVGGVLAASVAKGFKRLDALDQAQAKFKGLGVVGNDLTSAMDSVNKSVKGTAFGLDEAAGSAAKLSAVGVQLGSDMARSMTLVADIAAQAGTDMDDISSIMAKIAGAGKVTGETLAQLDDRATGAGAALADHLGVSIEEVRAKVSAGQVSFEEFQEAMEKHLGGAAQKTGETFKGAFANMGAAAGRLGAKLLDPAFTAAPALFVSIGTAFDSMGKSVEPAFERLGTALVPAMERFGTVIEEKIAPAAGQAAGAIADFVANIVTDGLDSDVWARLGEGFSKIAGAAADAWPSVSELVSSLGSVGANIGVATWEAFANILNAVAPILSGAVVPALNSVTRIMESNPGIVNAAVQAFTGFKAINTITGPLGTMGTAISGAADKAKTFGGAVKTSFDYAAQAAPNASKMGQAFLIVKENATSAFSTLMKSNPVFSGLGKVAGVARTAMSGLWVVMAANPVAAIITGVSLLVAGLVWFFTKTETGRKIFQAAMDAIKTAWDAVVNALKAGWDWLANSSFGEGMAAAWDMLKEKWDEFVIGFGQFYDTWVQPLVDFAQMIGDAFSTALDWVKEKLGEAVEWFSEKFNQLMKFLEPFTTLISNGFRVIGDIIKSVWDGAVKTVFDAWQTATDLLGNALTTFSNIAKVAWSALGQAISAVYNNIIKPPLSFFRQLAGLLADVLTGNFSNIGNRFREMGNALKATVMGPINLAFDLFKIAANFARDAFNAFRDGVGNAVNRIKGFITGMVDNFREVPGKIKSAFANAGTWLLDAGKSIIRGLADGIRAAGSMVADAIRAVVPDNLARFVPGLEFGGIVPAFARGGMLPTTGPGTDTVDGILGINDKGIPVARVNAGEFIINAESTKKHKHLLAAINADTSGTRFAGMGTSGDGLPRYARGGIISAPDLLRFARGETVNGKRAARSLQGASYVWGGSNWGDCSGAMSQFAAAVSNAGNWFTRKFATGTQGGWLAQHGFKRGLGSGPRFATGFFNGGPWGGHTSGTIFLGGGKRVNVEMGGGAGGQGKVGGAAAGADHQQYTDRWYYPLKGSSTAKKTEALASGEVESTSTQGITLSGGEQIDWGEASNLAQDIEKERSLARKMARWRKGAFDQGGIARGLGFMPKATIKPERVLNPSNTKSFDKLPGALADVANKLGVSAEAQGMAAQAMHNVEAAMNNMTAKDVIRFGDMLGLESITGIVKGTVSAYDDMEAAFAAQVDASDGVKQAEKNLATARAEQKEVLAKEGNDKEKVAEAAKNVREAELALSDARSVVTAAAKAAGHAEIALAIEIASMVIDVVDKIAVAIAGAVSKVREGVASMMASVRELVGLSDSLRDGLALARVESAEALVRVQAAYRGIRMAQFDGARSQLEAAVTVAEAQKEFDAQRKADMRAAMRDYRDLSLTFDRWRWAMRNGIEESLDGMAAWSDESHALWAELQAAQIGRQLAEKQAQLDVLESVYAHHKAVLDLQQATVDLGVAAEKFAVLTGKSFGYDNVEATIGSRYAELVAERASLRADNASAKTWLNPVNWFTSMPAASRRIAQIDEELKRLSEMPGFKPLSPEAQREVNRLTSQAGWMGLFGQAVRVEDLVRNSALGDAARALDDVKFQQDVIDARTAAEKARLELEGKQAEVDKAKQLAPLEALIDQLRTRQESEKTWAEYWREDDEGVRRALADLAGFQADSAEVMGKVAAEKTVVNVPLPPGKTAFTVDEVRATLESISKAQDALDIRMGALERPVVSGARVADARKVIV